jgi:Glycosyl transferase family group 2
MHLQTDLLRSNSALYRFMLYLKRSTLLNSIAERKLEVFSLLGGNMSVRREVFNRLGGFDRNFHFGGEEEDFWKRVAESGTRYRVIYIPTAVVYHDYLPSFRNAARRSRAYGVGNARMYWKHGDVRPTIYPFRIASLTPLVLIGISPLFVLVSLGMPLVLYPGWSRAASRERDPSLLVFADVQMILEAYTDLGFVSGYLKFRKSYAVRASETNA